MTRRALLLAACAGAALSGAASAAAADVPGDAPATGYATAAPWSAVAHWTQERREQARPLPLLTLAGAPPASAVGTASVPAASTAAGEGADTGDPTAFPNRANGVVYGEFATAAGREPYQCSGSVVDSGAGNVVLTAGHCVIDPETGALATALVFVPGYREGAAPYGTWAVSRYAVTDEWAATAGGRNPDEGADLAFLVLADDAGGATVEDAVGAFGIAFDQPREQTYTQWGYPAEAPYDGEALYSNTAAYGGGDPSFSPPPMRIASDFTGGSSGGPWTVDVGGMPTVLSLTDYTYEALPHSVYGAYLGAAAGETYEVAAGERAPTTPGVTGGESSIAPPTPGEVGSPSPATPVAGAADPAGSGTGAAPGAGSLRIVSVRRDPARGTATLLVAAGGPGTLRLSGTAVRTVSLEVTAAGTYRLAVAPRTGVGAARALRRHGIATVGVWIRLAGPAGVRQLSHLVRLRRAPAAH